MEQTGNSNQIQPEPVQPQPIQPQPVPPLNAPQPEFVYAGFWRRFAAYLIDKLIFSVAGMIFFVPFIALVGFSRFISRHDVESMAFILSIVMVYVMIGLLMVVAEWLYSRDGIATGRNNWKDGPRHSRDRLARKTDLLWKSDRPVFW